jgi:hypothetical protein
MLGEPTTYTIILGILCIIIILIGVNEASKGGRK